MYTLNQLEIFVRVADRGSFNKAAEEMFVTPSAVMKHMNNLEKELGADLFTRTYRGQNLTKAGEQFYKDAKKILELCNASVENVKTVAMQEQNIIRLGTSIMYPSEVLAELWQEVQKRHNDIRIEIVPFDITPNSEGYIIPYPGTSIDVAVSTFDDVFLKARNVNALEVEAAPLCVNMAMNHRLASKEIIEIEDLEGETLITVSEERSGPAARFRKLLSDKGIVVKVEEIQGYSIETYNRCASSDAMLLGMGLQIKLHPLLKRIPINVDITNPFGLIYAKEPTSGVKRFIEIVEGIVAEGWLPSTQK